jgi:hypothetical protein
MSELQQEEEQLANLTLENPIQGSNAPNTPLDVNKDNTDGEIVKKYAKDFTFGRVLGEGAYGAVRFCIYVDILYSYIFR